MQRLSGLDATFLYLETPEMHMHVAMAAVLDPSGMPGGYSFEKVQDLIESRVHLVPPFRRRLLPVPLSLNHPVWVDDPHFDIIHHVRRVALPAPGGLRELGAMAGRILSSPLDRSRPLWEAWVIEGLEGGRFAVLCKVHHCAVDGASGAGLMQHLFDLEREPAAPPAPPPRFAVSETLPTDWELLAGAALTRLQQPASFARLAARTVKAAREVVRTRLSPDVPSGATPLTAPRTHFNGALTASRNAAFSRVPLSGVKRIKNAFGCTVNDVVLAISAGALRAYLDHRGSLPGLPLVAVCPISVRTDAQRGESNNRVSAMFTSLCTDVADPVERLQRIRQSTQGAKHEHNAIGAEMLQDWAEYAAPSTFALATRMYTRMKLADVHRPIHNLIISNVPGPPFAVYLAGAELVAAYPMGPVMEGSGLNITVMSYRGQVDFGFMVASDLVPDVWDLAAAVEPAYQELLQAAERVEQAAQAAG